MVRKSGVTLQDLLQLDCMQGVSIVAGHNGLDRVVNNINIMEVPDIANWVNAGDLLLTTAYSIRNDHQAQLELVPQLAEKGLAGLALKPKRYLPCIPPEMIELANRLNFPLLEMPLEVSFAQVINPILSEILQMQTSYLQKSEDAHRLFMEVMLKGGGLGNIANTLAALIDNPVMILADTQEVLANSHNFTDAIPSPMLKVKNKGPTVLVDPLESGIKYLKTEVTPTVHAYRAAIVAREKTWGYLTIWDTQRPLRQNDFIAIERAMTIIALEVLNEISLREIERRYRNEFLDELLCKEQASDKELVDRARHLGWDLGQDYAALLLAANNHAVKPELSAQQAKELLFQQINGVMSAVEKFILGTKSDSIIVLLARPEALPGEQVPAYFKRRAEDIYDALYRKVPNVPFNLGLGRFYHGIAGLRRSYNEALKALALAQDQQKKLICFADLGIERLLQQVTDLRELEAFYRETILPLDRHDSLYNTQLVQTLSAYFTCNGNLKQTSKLIYSHYNTVLYRIERIEALTGLCLKSYEHRLNLMVGLQIRRMLCAKGVKLL